MAKAREYPILVGPITEEDGGGFIAIVPDLKGCISDGATPEEALANGYQAVLEWIDAATEAGQQIPEPHSAQRYALKQHRDMEAKISEQAKTLAVLDAEIKILRADVEAFGTKFHDTSTMWSLPDFGKVILKEDKVH